MMRKAAAIVLALACLPMLAQSSLQPHAGPYRIAGTVLDAVTGAPVRGATVAALAVEDSRHIASAVSGNDGRFAIDGLAAAKYQLTASRRGYSTAFYDQHEGGDFNSAIVAGGVQNSNLDIGNLVFRLVPGAVLRGVVTADGGDPVAGAQVMLFEKPQAHEPDPKIAQVDTAITDDTGAYEFGNLATGEYLLAVKAEPWYAMHGAAGGWVQTASTEANPALDVAYPITYFDSTTDEASASPIVVAGGSRAEADIVLHAVPALRLEVESRSKQDGSIVRPELRQNLFGAAFLGESPGYMDASMVFPGVAPGQYELTQGDPPRVLVLDANASQQVEPDAGLPAVAVSGTLQTASGAPLPDGAAVTLESADSSQGLQPMESSFNRGAFSFAAVPAGTWKLRVEQAGLRTPVLSIVAGGRTRAGNLVTVQDRPLTLVVKLSTGGMRVEGFVQKAGKGQAGAMVLLVPKDAASFPDLVRRDQSDSDGSFSLRDVAPGQYTVGAIEDGWALDWTRPEGIARYLPGGIAVTVSDTLDKVVRLSGPVPVQER